MTLNKNKLNKLPEIENLTMVEELGLAFNEFKDFPSQVCKLPALKTLDLTGNSIKSIPESCSKTLTTLFVQLHHNNIITQHQQHFFMVVFLFLKCHRNIGQNGFTTFPEGLLQWDQLVTLDLSHNSMNSIGAATAASYPNLKNTFVFTIKLPQSKIKQKTS